MSWRREELSRWSVQLFLSRRRSSPAVFTLSGETSERYRGIVSRTKEPKRFSWDVVLYFLAGLFFIGLYLYQNSN